MGDSLTKDERRLQLYRIRAWFVQTVDTHGTDLDMNSFHDTLQETSEEEVALIRAEKEDGLFGSYLKSLDARARTAIVSAAGSGKLMVNKVVWDCRYKGHSLVSETDKVVIMHDKMKDKGTRWLVKASILQWSLTDLN